MLKIQQRHATPSQKPEPASGGKADRNQIDYLQKRPIHQFAAPSADHPGDIFQIG
jgi:hypothetical protein